jgi:hypothetical protein
MPYTGSWGDDPQDAVRLYQGQRAILAVVGLLPQGGENDRHYLPQFNYFDRSSHPTHRFFGNRITTMDEIDEREPLTFKVTIGSLPSMAKPFVGLYRLPKKGPLLEVS